MLLLSQFDCVARPYPVPPILCPPTKHGALGAARKRRVRGQRARLGTCDAGEEQHGEAQGDGQARCWSRRRISLLIMAVVRSTALNDVEIVN